MDKDIVVKIKFFVILMFILPQMAMAVDSLESRLVAIKKNYYASLHKVIKVKDPGKLVVLVYSESTCPLTADEIYEITDGVLIRSRIKPIHYISEEHELGLYLDISLKCIKKNSDFYTFVSDVYFADSSGDVNVLYDYSFGNYGNAPKEFIKQEVKSYIEDAVTQYVKANFDF